METRPGLNEVRILRGATDSALRPMRPASLTHHFDPDQRYLELEIPSATPDPANPSKWTLQVNPPSDPSLMPPGYYMLFFRAGAAVSTSASVRLQ